MNKHTVAVTAGLLMFTIITLYPIYWLIVNAFGINASGQSFVSVAIQNFQNVFQVMGYSYLNSLIIAGTATVISVIICSMSAYAFARIDFRGRNALFDALVLPYLLPTVLLIIPLYVIFKTMGVINTFLPLILLYQLLMGPVNVWIGTDFLKSIPKAIEESALIDGCDWLGVFRRVTLPLMVPGLVTMTVLTFIASWNEFILATTFLNRRSLYTFTKAIFIFSAVNAKGSIDWGFVSAASVIGLTPLVIFLLILRKYLISGLAKGAVKA